MDLSHDYNNRTHGALQSREVRVPISGRLVSIVPREAHFSQQDIHFPLNSNLATKGPETLRACLGYSHYSDNSLLQCTLFPGLPYIPFPQSSISELELAKNLLRPQSTLVLSTGEANLGAHNFSNEKNSSTVIEAEAQATRLLGQNVQCIQLPTEIMSIQHIKNDLIAGMLNSTSLEVGNRQSILTHCLTS